MKYSDFLKTVQDEISTKLDSDLKLQIRPVEKNNGKILDGLLIINPKLNIAPTIYLNPYYHWYLEGVSMDSIIDSIISNYNEISPKENFSVERFLKFDTAKNYIVFQLVNYEKNEKKLQNLPHIKYLDFAIIFQIVASKDSTKALAAITYPLFEKWEITMEELIRVAMENTEKLMPYEIINLNDYVDEYFKEFDFSNQSKPKKDDLEMYVLTNKEHTRGATSILYPNLLSSIAQKINDDLIIIPSSIHEVILVAASSATASNATQDLCEFICEVNSSQLADEEVLAERYYVYDRQTDSVK